MSTGHHKDFPPSAANRWLGDGDGERLGCTASVAGIRALVAAGATADRPSEYAAEGTVAHEVLAKMQTSPDEVDPVGSIVECDGYDIEVTDEMHECALWAIERIEASRHDGTIVHEWVETKVVVLSTTGEELTTGTADYMRLIERPAGGGLVLQVYDYKYGKGVAVSARDPQLRLYARGGMDRAYDELMDDVTEVECHVLQPRINWTHDVARFTHDEMVSFLGRAWVQVHESDQDPQFRPHEDACRFCPLAPCKAMAELVEQEVEAGFGDLDAEAGFGDLDAEPPAFDAGRLSGADMGALLKRFPLWQQLMNAVQEAAFMELESGGEVPDWKLVLGKQGNREWTDEATVIDKLKKARRVSLADYQPPGIVSPTKAERVNKDFYKEVLVKYVTRKDAKPILVPESDPRDAWSKEPDAGFDEVDPEVDPLLA